MDTIKTKAMPVSNPNLAKEIIEFATTFIPYATVFGIFWKAIDAIAKYLSDGRDARTKELINEVTKPLSDNIDKLTKSIWELGNKIENK